MDSNAWSLNSCAGGSVRGLEIISLPFSFQLRYSLWRGEGICLKGVEYDEKMDGPLFNINLFISFPPRVCRSVERYQDSMFEMRLLL